MEIHHIARRADWDDARRSGQYNISTLGATLEDVGFIHGSTARQLETVALAFYADEPAELVVLVMDDDQIRSSGTAVVYEDGGDGEAYPHIYGPIIPDWVTEVRTARFEDGRFVTSLNPDTVNADNLSKQRGNEVDL